MKGRTLLVSLIVGAGIAVSAAADAAVVLKVHHFQPATSPAQKRFIEPWCAKIEKESQGELKCQIFHSMQLGGRPGDLITQVKDGTVDIVWTLPGYTPGRFPVSELFELPFVTWNSLEGSARAFWHFATKFAANEFAGTKPLALWVNGSNVFHFRDAKPEKLEDFAGLKIRAPSRLGNKILAALGATPVGMPVPQLPEALSRGVVDGALIPWEVVPVVRVEELTKFHAEPSGMRVLTRATMIWVMNEAKYQSLPDHLKKVIDANSGPETSAWIVAQYIKAAEVVGREKAAQRGNTIYAFSPEMMKAIQAATAKVVAEWKAEAKAVGLDADHLLNEAEKLIQEYR